MHDSIVNIRALAISFARKTEIDTILARLTTLSAEHFNRVAEHVTRGDIGTLCSYLEGLHEVASAAFHAGEHAV